MVDLCPSLLIYDQVEKHAVVTMWTGPIRGRAPLMGYAVLLPGIGVSPP